LETELAKKSKVYVLDTNAMLEDPQIFNKFENAELVIPFICLEELDKHKTAKAELGAKARNVIRTIDDLSAQGDLFTGVKLSKTTKVRVAAWDKVCKKKFDDHDFEDSPDNRILATTLVCGKDAELLTNDVSLRLKAKSFGITASGHSPANRPTSIDEIYSGIVELKVSSEKINELYAQGELPLPNKLSLYPNEYVHFRSADNDGHTAIARFDGSKLLKVSVPKVIGGIKPKNLEQTVAFDALLNPDITLVSLLGKAGVGKSLLAMAAAIEMVVNSQQYDKIIIMRSPVSVGPEIGFLPGDLESKTREFFSFVGSSIEVLFGSKGKTAEQHIEHLVDMGRLQLITPTFIRGMSIANTIIIADECQNFSIHEMKTIASRLSENSRLFVLGDLQQCDVAHLDAFNNGLTAIVEAFKDEPCAAHLTLHKSERSAFADLVADKL
jgi:PhoH-like ATPase